MTKEIPHAMRAVRLLAYGDAPRLQVERIAVPRPGPGQVLVRVTAAPILPLDRTFLRGRHGHRKPLPVTPGLEGVGVVVAAGGGLAARWLLGRRVACLAGGREDGTWAEYAVVDAAACLPVWPSLTDARAACMAIYPVAALGLLDELRQAGHRASVHTGSRDLLDRMITRLAVAEGYPLVHVVRDDEQAQALRALGAEAVVVHADPAFDGKLRRAVAEVRATALIDAVGGSLTGRVLDALPDGAEAIVYDARTEEPVRLDTHGLVHREQRVRGLLVLDHVRRRVGRLLARLPQLQRHIGGALATPIAAELGLDEVPEAVAGSSGMDVALLVRPSPREGSGPDA